MAKEGLSSADARHMAFSEQVLRDAQGKVLGVPIGKSDNTPETGCQCVVPEGAGLSDDLPE